MAEKTVVIVDPAGMHARPASKVAHLAASFDEDVSITYKARTIDAKSIMGLMSLGVPKDAEITIQVNGDDDESILSSILGEMKELGLI
jgi:phosphocarrier protein